MNRQTSETTRKKMTITGIFKYLFWFIFSCFDFMINNTIGLIFTRSYQAFGKKQTHPKWRSIRKTIYILLLLVAVYLFDTIYLYTLDPILNFLFKLLSGDNNIYQKILRDYGIQFVSGIQTTLKLSLVGTVIGLLIALLFSYLITLKIEYFDSLFKRILKKLSHIWVKFYVTIIRGTPMMVQAMIIYYGVKVFINWSPITAAFVTVSINTAAYLTEVLRGSILALDKGQYEAARSLGLSNWQTTRKIIYPQAIKNAMPSIGNEFVINIKDTSVLNVIQIVDVFRVAEYAAGSFLESFPAFIIAALIYLCLTYTVTKILRVMEKRLELPEIALPSAN